MSIKIPENKPEKVKSFEEAEGVVEMSPEDLQLMVSEISTFKDMLREWEAKLADLEKDPNASAEEIETLKNDIEELRYQISEREELLEE